MSVKLQARVTRLTLNSKRLTLVGAGAIVEPSEVMLHLLHWKHLCLKASELKYLVSGNVAEIEIVVVAKLSPTGKMVIPTVYIE